MKHLLEAQDLHQRFFQNRYSGRHVVHALNGVSFFLEEGETLGVVGETGCGKSTLCRTIMGLAKPSSGRILLEDRELSHGRGKEARARRTAMQMVFQDPADSMNPRMDVESILSEPLVIQTRKSQDHHREALREILTDVGMPTDILERYPHEFSGGQRQRLAIARALVLKPRILVCDEPVSALDVSVQAQILNLLMDMQTRHRLAMVFVSHALGLVRHLSDRILVMYLGFVVEEGLSDQVMSSPAHPYTKRLVESNPGIEDLERTPAERGMVGMAAHDRAGKDSSARQPGRDFPAGGPGETGSPSGTGTVTGTVTGSGTLPGSGGGKVLPDNLEPPLPTKIPLGCPYQAACPLAVERCVRERPVLRDAGQGRRVACHLA